MGEPHVDRRTAIRRGAAAVVGGLVVTVAGCSGEEPAPGLHAVATSVIHRRNYPDLDYPGDVGVRVEVENTSADRRSGTLDVTLVRSDDSAEGEATWTQSRTVTLQSVTTRAYRFVYEDVFGDGDETAYFSASAAMSDGASTGTGE